MNLTQGSANDQAGFTLLEVLVTAVILSISLLGLIALQGIAKFSSYEARQRTLAVYAASDIVERLRINKTPWIDQHLNSSGASWAVSVGKDQTVQTKPACINDNGITTASCSYADLVNNDLYSWQQLLSNAASNASSTLIDPVGCLSLSRINSQSAATATIVISWQDRESIRDAAETTGQTCGTADAKHRQFVLSTTL
jgi:type IV pilus modification protein PilV